MASLVLTRPGWPHPLNTYTIELAKGLQTVGVDLFAAPLQRFVAQPLGPEQHEQWRACLKKSASDRVWLVSTSPSAAYAMVQQPELLKDLSKAITSKRLIISGIGRASMMPLLRWIEQSGSPVEVLAPDGVGLAADPSPSVERAGAKMSVTSADASAYLRWIGDQPIAADTLVLLEARQNREDLALGLAPLCKRVLRLPIYRREALPMPVFSPRPSEPLFVVVTSSSLVTPAIEGLDRQDLPVQSVIWVAHHPAIVQAIRLQLPDADCLSVDGLEVDKMVEHIKLRL